MKIILKIIRVILIPPLTIYITLLCAFQLNQNLLELLVTTAMNTTTHQYIAYIFAPSVQVDYILDKNRTVTVEVIQDFSLVKSDYRETVVEEQEMVTTTEPQTIDIYEESRAMEIYLEGLREIELAKEKEEEEIRLRESYFSDNGYELLEEGIHIKEVSGTGFRGKLVLVENPLRLQAGLTRFPNVKGDHLKVLVPMHDVTLGMNGGCFNDPNYSSKGGVPLGYVLQNGESIYVNTSSKNVIAGINNEGILIVGKYSLKEAKELNIQQAMSGFPILIVNGDKQITKGDGGWGIAPRTAIGQTSEGYILLLVIDGRQTHSIGASMKQVQDVLYDNHAITAIAMDGGSSTAMYYDGEYLNSPSQGFERRIPTFWFVM